MKRKDKDKILAAIARLQACDSELSAREAEKLLMEVLDPLLTEDGYHVQQTTATSAGGLDFLAHRPASKDYQDQTLGIEFKYYRSGRSVSVEQVMHLIGAAVLHNMDRAKSGRPDALEDFDRLVCLDGYSV